MWNLLKKYIFCTNKSRALRSRNMKSVEEIHFLGEQKQSTEFKKYEICWRNIFSLPTKAEHLDQEIWNLLMKYFFWANKSRALNSRNLLKKYMFCTNKGRALNSRNMKSVEDMYFLYQQKQSTSRNMKSVDEIYFLGQQKQNTEFKKYEICWRNIFSGRTKADSACTFVNCPRKGW